MAEKASSDKDYIEEQRRTPSLNPFQIIVVTGIQERGIDMAMFKESVVSLVGS